MIRNFLRKDLEDIVAPYDLRDTLESLKSNGLITEYTLLHNSVKIDLPISSEVGDLFNGLNNVIREVTTKRRTH